MKVIDLYQETKSSLLANVSRTFLTVLGIVIGIASVIIMLSIGQGAQNSISSTINSLGTNVLTVRSGGTQSGPGQVNTGESVALTTKDSDAIKSELALVKAVSPVVQTRGQVVAGSKNTNATIIGATPGYADVSSVKVDIGNFITEKNNREYAKVAVLGPTVKDTLFGTEDAIGKQIKIRTNSYTVIGVTVSKGGSLNNADENIYIPLSTVMQYMTGGNSVQSIAVTTENSEDMTQLQEDLTNLLLARHKISDPNLADFRISSQADLLETASTITSMFTILLGSVAGISLVVGGIGIMNMMLTTVRERTKEIGLRKAIGAQKKDIQKQFLAEAVTITVSGGIIGIILGYLVSWAITYSGVITTSVSAFSVFLSFSVSVAIGLTFGYYPARKAAQLNPIDALRYE